MEQMDLFIGGALTGAKEGEATDVVEAATGEVMGRVMLGGAADIDAAVTAAEAASASWAARDPRERADVLVRFADHLTARAVETATLVSRQNGMPITLSTGANGYFPGLVLRYYAGLVRDAGEPDVRPGMRGTRTRVERTPIGVVGAITPWNYPQTLAAMKYAPALAAGCAVVLKPPPETALDAYVLAEAAEAAGLPPGVLNIVPGGRDAGARLVAHPGVAKVAFTGSTAAGRAIGAVCGELLKPVTLELGGKSAAILLDDVDLASYLGMLPRVSLPNAGQTCHSSTRILAPRARYDEVVDAVTDTVRGLVVGDPLDRATQIGPMVSAAHRGRVLDHIDVGRAEGARLTTGGGVPADREAGWFVEPTVFADVDNSWRIAQEEIFGPVLCVIPYDDEEDAVRIANDSDYGLAGTVWTSDEERGVAVARRVHTGSIGVNHFGLDPAAPFGGWKASGLGTELGPEGLEAYRRPKSIYLPAGSRERTRKDPV
ncbi:aldehyde dehydrogenase [Actinocorallia aurantiaca]|uniref:Aldehyde dehydrogenase n=1 Tax=Actinocorallia aurantiaca TaxID=46204 RepID=A0ABN3UPI2_9ACTN